MTVGIYGVFDSETNECLYVGLSTDIEGRWRNHISCLIRGKHKSQDFVTWFKDRKMNLNTLDFKILEECEDDDSVLNLLEHKWFNILSPKFAGKIPSENEKWRHSENSRKNISEGVRKRFELNGVYENRLCHCGTSFNVRTKLSIKYCSAECRPVRIRKVATGAICAHCNQVESSPGAKYCSKVCFNLSTVVELNKDRLFDLYWNQELSLKAIAELENVSRQTIYNKMKQFGIARREKEIASGMER